MMAIGLLLILIGVVLALIKGTNNPFVVNPYEFVAGGLVIIGITLFAAGMLYWLWMYAP